MGSSSTSQLLHTYLPLSVCYIVKEQFIKKDLQQHAAAYRDTWCEVRGRTQFSESSLLCIIQLGPLDDDSVGRQVDAPGQGGCAAQHFEQALPKEALYQVAVGPQHAGMMDAYA